MARKKTTAVPKVRANKGNTAQPVALSNAL